MTIIKLPFMRKGIRGKILLPAVVMTVVIGVITVMISSKIITESIESRVSENIENNERLISEMLREKEEKVAFYSQFMSDMVKLSHQISGTPIGRSMLIYLLEFLERERVEIHLYRSKHRFGDARRLLIQKGLLGIRTTAFLELNRGKRPYLTVAGVSPIERKEGIFEVVIATFDIDENFLNGIKKEAGADLHFFYGDGTVLSTLDDPACVAKMRDMLTGELRTSLRKETSQHPANLNCVGNPQKVIFKPRTVNFQPQGLYAISVPMSDLLLARKRLMLQVVLIMVIVLFVGIAIFSSLTVRRIVDPIQELSQVTKKVADGDLTQSLIVRPGDELGELGDNFNQMIRQLHAARSAMEAHHERQMERAERLAVLGQMASGVAHEFNNLLAIVLANAQLMLRSIGDDDRALRRVKAIEQAAKDGAQTVQRIQEFARVRKDEYFVSVDVNGIVDDVVAATKPRWREQAQKEGHPVEMEVRLGEVTSVSGNSAELREVITNLIFNALDAMPQGGKIAIETGMDDRQVFITVGDTGEGMSEEVQHRIFDPFFTTKGVSSSGLGLSVSYGIISRHNGEILVESEEGKGALFTIRLPLRAGEDEITPSEVAFDIHKSGSVLIIDDEKGILDALTDMLTAMGHQVTTAESGREGLEKFRETRHDVVFTDLGMPDMNGWEIARSVKEINPHTPVAIVTGWHLGLSKEKMKTEGVDLVVTKPFEINKLQRVMAEALELKSRM